MKSAGRAEDEGNVRGPLLAPTGSGSRSSKFRNWNVTATIMGAFSRRQEPLEDNPPLDMSPLAHEEEGNFTGEGDNGERIPLKRQPLPTMSDADPVRQTSDQEQESSSALYTCLCLFITICSMPYSLLAGVFSCWTSKRDYEDIKSGP